MKAIRPIRWRFKRRQRELTEVAHKFAITSLIHYFLETKQLRKAEELFQVTYETLYPRLIKNRSYFLHTEGSTTREGARKRAGEQGVALHDYYLCELRKVEANETKQYWAQECSTSMHIRRCKEREERVSRYNSELLSASDMDISG